jgi:GNAT superfamily N-acetyltransferase
VFLYDMAVDPARQRRGLGRTCIEGAIRAARAWPADALRLDAYDHAAGAGPFYEKCGFRETSRRVFFRAPIIYYEMML